MQNGAFFTREYINLFAKIGILQDKIDEKIKDTFNTMFFDRLSTLSRVKLLMKRQFIL